MVALGACYLLFHLVLSFLYSLNRKLAPLKLYYERGHQWRGGQLKNIDSLPFSFLCCGIGLFLNNTSREKHLCTRGLLAHM